MQKGDANSVVTVLRQQATTLPLGTSSGGFTWEFDPVLGIVVRKSRSFGPIFVERPLTVGRGKFSFGVTTQHTSWRTLAGQQLPTDGLYASEEYTDEGLYTDDLQRIRERYGSRIDLQTDRTTINASYGVTDRLDINVIVPFGRSSVVGESTNTVTLVDLHRNAVDNARDFAAAGSGLGDLAAGTKYLALSTPRVAVGISGELRFPTGSTEKLLGAGALEAKVAMLATSTVGPFNPHVEIGRVFGGTGLTFQTRSGVPQLTAAEPSPETTYAAGVDVATSTRITVAADLLARHLSNAATIIRTDVVRPFFANFTREIVSFHAEPSSMTLLLGTVGAKIAVGSSWLLTGSLLFPLSDAGLTPAITPVVGFERAF